MSFRNYNELIALFLSSDAQRSAQAFGAVHTRVRQAHGTVCAQHEDCVRLVKRRSEQRLVPLDTIGAPAIDGGVQRDGSGSAAMSMQDRRRAQLATAEAAAADTVAPCSEIEMAEQHCHSFTTEPVVHACRVGFRQAMCGRDAKRVTGRHTA